MNIHIVKGLLNDCPAPDIPSSTAYTSRTPLSFGCDFSKIQLEGIAACANRFCLFCNEEITADDMAALFSCQPDFHIRVYNCDLYRYGKRMGLLVV